MSHPTPSTASSSGVERIPNWVPAAWPGFHPSLIIPPTISCPQASPPPFQIHLLESASNHQSVALPPDAHWEVLPPTPEIIVVG